MKIKIALLLVITLSLIGCSASTQKRNNEIIMDQKVLSELKPYDDMDPLERFNVYINAFPELKEWWEEIGAKGKGLSYAFDHHNPIKITLLMRLSKELEAREMEKSKFLSNKIEAQKLKLEVIKDEIFSDNETIESMKMDSVIDDLHKISEEISETEDDH